MGDGQLGRYGKVERDPHGHLRLGEIEFGRMIKDRLSARLEEIGLKTMHHRQGPGLRACCADPIPFDAEYTRDLGYGAVKFLRSAAAAKLGPSSASSAAAWSRCRSSRMINPQTGRMQPRKVDVDGEAYECARRYMIRLERADFERAQARRPWPR